MADRSIVGFQVDTEGHCVALLSCGHKQHVRHDPPWQEREWVLSEVGRNRMLGSALPCPFCDMPALPPSALLYKTTAIFDQHSVPKGLLADHRTKEGTWGRILVLEGSLLYALAEPSKESWVLRPDIPGIIAPTIPHHVGLIGPVRFKVEFLRSA